MDDLAQENPVAAGELQDSILPPHSISSSRTAFSPPPHPPTSGSLMTQPASLHLELTVWFGLVSGSKQSSQVRAVLGVGPWSGRWGAGLACAL